MMTSQPPPQQREPLVNSVHKGRFPDKANINKVGLHDRGQWASKGEFLLSVAGQIIGLGNVWRFPYLCYRNGGGVFFVPYLLFLVLCGIPLFLLETSLGQYTSLGGVSAWTSMCPIFGGLGYASQMMILHGCVYYIVILAWALFYLSSSFQAELPWSHCNNSWNTEACFMFDHHNQTSNGSNLPENVTSPVTEFWEREVLHLPDSLDNLGPISWKLALCLAIVWLVCYFCVWKGIKSSGKVVYLTATFPYVMLIVLLVRGATLPGATQGIIYYLKPNHTRLADPQVWMDAGTQIFFSFGICLGSLTALGSYNKYNNDCYKDSYLLCLLNSSTSFLAGFAIFSVLGFMAEEQGVDIATVAQSGPGLAFIAFPRAVAMMPLPQLWAICFFLMIIMLGLDTQFVSLEALMTSVTDLYPHLIRRGYRRELLLLFICVVCFLIGLIMVTPGGLYVFQIYDHFSCSGASLLLLSIFQSIAIGWIYGADRFCSNIKDMTGHNPLLLFKLCWKYLTPAVCTATFLFSVVCWSPLRLGKGLVAPGWATALGWLLTLSSVSLLPIWAIYALAITPGTLTQRFCHLCNPTVNLPQAFQRCPDNSTTYSVALPLSDKPKETIGDIIRDHVG
ncbi:sodium- and chloride-dependent GABA transporter 2-like isoform X1 [Phyllopteryx taeniolatus]|uniref:sodium- and chloride-dependent GABA transporter 2-like isoform X1 n=2 Tax=Phyllopteryx taeniolatus TaxID=161469 RepID=UPI002AD2BA09|nr:sodium- and chloride-dependent GABA transporter 2-like isoform X1 [Phyllopteryx taeniolatus]XP_061654429.1 sodium- and chloride-dependent GABA transporter 2-like isoform X1 [Phyllopteryx taeniolatus]XP_061654434.1 sodium- and chloride-dependent GABA transporter 2-like isoform X1 [Phyllopteryx taeniolatus]XP_061654442.1 sodium- and chloride-dependent GABA transporter 2-like isoform X1 [Phyllopteryx taeniolatus]XP_061654449.1 sodium- and chloride-dependent GABA transporter 2-like isoform X1 [P